MRRGSRLVEPDRIQAHDVEDAEIGSRVETLDVIVPDLVDPFPGDRQQRRGPFPHGRPPVGPSPTPRGGLFPLTTPPSPPPPPILPPPQSFFSSPPPPP